MELQESKHPEFITVPRRWFESLIKYSNRAIKDIDDHFDELCVIPRSTSIDILFGFISSAELMLQERKPNQK